MHRSPNEKVTDYLASTHQDQSFTTVEEFWSIYAHLKPVSELPFISDHLLFWQNVKPIWEDPVNSLGGKWVVWFPRGLKPPAVANASHPFNVPMGQIGKQGGLDTQEEVESARQKVLLLWEKVVLAIVGGSFGFTNDVVGLTLSVREDEDILSIWTRPSCNHETERGSPKFREALGNLLDLPKSRITFRMHSASLKREQQSKLNHDKDGVLGSHDSYRPKSYQTPRYQLPQHRSDHSSMHKVSTRSNHGAHNRSEDNRAQFLLGSSKANSSEDSNSSTKHRNTYSNGGSPKSFKTSAKSDSIW